MTAADATRRAGEAYRTRLARGEAATPDDKTVWISLEKHPYIVRAYLVERFKSLPYVITEYVRGPEGMEGDAPCELVISDDPDLSRRHARIFWSGSSWMLEDLDSSNGTFIGEFQVARRLSGPAAIEDGHIFRVGLTRLRLGSTKDKRVATAAAAAKATRS